VAHPGALPIRIGIVGAGAVGGHLAVRLAHAGADVSVVARGAGFDAVAARGLTLLRGDERTTVRLRASPRSADLGPQDAVIVAVKATALHEIADALPPLLARQTPVVFTCNGIPWWYPLGLAHGPRALPDLGFLDPGGKLASAVGARRIVGCVVNSSNAVVEPGVVRNLTPQRNRFALGAPGGKVSPQTEALAGALRRAGVDAPIVTDIRAAVWTKLVYSISLSPICALVRRPLAALGESRELLRLANAVRREGLAVAAAHGFAPNVGELLPEAMLGLPHKPSMLQDLERGRPMEIDAMLVATQAFARAAGVPTPLLDALTAMVGSCRGNIEQDRSW